MRPKKLFEVKEFIGILLTIGTIKNGLPLNLRGWLNILGLYVQHKSLGGWERLQAGEKWKGYFNAFLYSKDDVGAFLDIGKWEIKKFDRKGWANRFAHLVLPTSDIALFVSGGNPYVQSGSQFDQPSLDTLNTVVKHFEFTGEWLSLPSYRICVFCGRDLTLEQWQNQFCIFCGKNLRIKGILSCDKCKYGPSFFSCFERNFGSQKTFEPIRFNQIAPSPLNYYISNSSQMFCFQS